MENRQNKPPEGGAASGHGGQKFHTDSEQAKLYKSKLRMESREERLNKARERLAKQKPPKKPGPIKRIARIAGHETHAFLHGKVYQEERDNVGVEGGHFVERSGEAALHYGRHKVRRVIREHPAKAADVVPVKMGSQGQIQMGHSQPAQKVPGVDPLGAGVQLVGVVVPDQAVVAEIHHHGEGLPSAVQLPGKNGITVAHVDKVQSQHTQSSRRLIALTIPHLADVYNGKLFLGQPKFPCEF